MTNAFLNTAWQCARELLGLAVQLAIDLDAVNVHMGELLCEIPCRFTETTSNVQQIEGVGRRSIDGQLQAFGDLIHSDRGAIVKMAYARMLGEW